MTLSVTKKKYPDHIAIRLLVDDKLVGWIQFEGDNLAYYGSTNCETIDHGSSVYIRNIMTTTTP